MLFYSIIFGVYFNWTIISLVEAGRFNYNFWANKNMRERSPLAVVKICVAFGCCKSQFFFGCGAGWFASCYENLISLLP